MARKSNDAVPEWSRRILAFRRDLNLTQGELGERLKTSAMAVSRWERGESEPPSELYIRLGVIAGDPLCWFFWGRAGLSTADVMRVLPISRAPIAPGKNRKCPSGSRRRSSRKSTRSCEFRCHSDAACPRRHTGRRRRQSSGPRPNKTGSHVGSAGRMVPESRGND